MGQRDPYKDQIEAICTKLAHSSFPIPYPPYCPHEERRCEDFPQKLLVCSELKSLHTDYINSGWTTSYWVGIYNTYCCLMFIGSIYAIAHHVFLKTVCAVPHFSVCMFLSLGKMVQLEHRRLSWAYIVITIYIFRWRHC